MLSLSNVLCSLSSYGIVGSTHTVTTLRVTATAVNHLRECVRSLVTGVGVRLKVGTDIEKIEGMGSGEGLCPPQLGVWGCPQKKNPFCAKNYAILSKFWYFFPILQQKGGKSPSPESGGLIPLYPLLRRLSLGSVDAVQYIII